MIDYNNFAFQGKIERSKLKGQKTTKDNKVRVLKNLAISGFVSQAVKSSNVSRRTVYHWKDTDQYFAELFYEIEEARKDWAEAQLYKNMGEGKETSTIFYLKTKAKDRGYSERIELTGADGEAIAVTPKLIKESSTDELFDILNKTE